MRKSNLKTRLMAILLTLCMALTFMPTTSFAERINEITTVDIGNVWKNLDATQPVAFTAEVNPNNSECTGKMEITEEQWIPDDDAVNASAIKSTDVNAPTPQAGVCYWYSVTLTASENYIFSDSFRNENDGLGSVHAIYDGTGFAFNGTDYMQKITVSDDKKTLTISTLFGVVAGDDSSQNDYVINNVIINNAPASCTVGEAPKATATKGDSEAYTFYEYWEEWVQTENGMEPVKFWYSDTEQMSRVPENQKITIFEEGRTYSYSIIVKSNENYTFASKDALSVILNGEDFTAKSEVLSDGASLMVGPVFMKSVKPVEQKEIETVEINNATLTFKDGDKPVFTGTTPKNTPYVIDYEGWFGTNNEFICSSDYWNNAYVERGWCDGLISSFKANTKYTYQFYLKLTDEAATEGYVFGSNTKLKVNGKTIKYQHSGETSVELLIGTELTMTPTGNADTEKIKMKKSNVSLSATSYTYNGKVKKPSVTVKDDKGKKVSSAYYTVSYAKGCKNVGTYAVTVKFKGNYSGTVRKTFTIKPKSTRISKLTAGRKKFTVKWKKQKTQTTGYQIRYSTSSKFKNAKTVTVSKNKTTGKTVSKLKAKKKYYVRVRTYKTVKAGGKSTKIYSSWSKAKTVKVK